MSDYSWDEKREQRFEKARSFLAYINLSSDELDPYTMERQYNELASRK